MAAATTPIKVDADTGRLISESAHFLDLTQKDFVSKAVRNYVDAHRAEINEGIRAAMRSLDGTDAAAISLVTGFSADRIAALGGLPE